MANQKIETTVLLKTLAEIGFNIEGVKRSNTEVSFKYSFDSKNYVTRVLLNEQQLLIYFGLQQDQLGLIVQENYTDLDDLINRIKGYLSR